MANLQANSIYEAMGKTTIKLANHVRQQAKVK